jgi:hypothetical protein
MNFLHRTHEGVYTGDLKLGVPDGKGEMVYFDDVTGIYNYSGSWSQGQKSGFGIMSWKNGDR